MTVILDRHHVDTISPATRAWAAFAQIEESPEQWCQDDSRTPISGGYAYDWAGWVLRLDGARWLDGSRYRLIARDDDPETDVTIVGGYRTVKADDRVRRLLGLSDEGVWLLVGLRDTDLEKLRTHIVEVFGEEDELTGRTS